MIEDSELLRRYAEEKSEAAFAELVRRRIGLVFSVALRHTGGDAHRAQDVTQAVFTALARKASTLCSRPVLAGWLYRSAQFAASDAVRAERRRQERAQEAYLMQQLDHAASEPDWATLRPALDEALNAMAENDRDAIALRFFEGRPFAQIGERLRLSENAARMRVDRALEKLRERLSRRGVTSTTAALAMLLATDAAAVAPAGLATTVATAATVGGGSIAAVVTFMTLTKVQLGLTSAAIVAGATGFAVQAKSNASLRAEIERLRPQAAEIADLRTKTAQLKQLATEAADLRRDDFELAKLRDEAEALKNQSRATARAQAAPVAASSTGNLDRQPKARFQAAPVYPPELRKAGISGEVLVGFVVDQDGQVQKPFAIQSTLREFEAPAIEAASKWIFDAGLKGGREVNTRMQVPIVFSADKDDATAGAREPGSSAASASPTSRFGDKSGSAAPNMIQLAPFEVKADGTPVSTVGEAPRRWF